MKNKMTTRKLTLLALFCALSVVACLLVRIPLVPSVSFLTYDPKDIIIGLAGFLFGPGSAAIVSCISSALELLLRGGNIIDWLMDVLSTCSYVCTAVWIYQYTCTKKGAALGMAAGMAANLAVMLIWNYLMDPIYFGIPVSAVIPMLPAIALFNILKDGINSVVLFFVYKPIRNALEKAGFIHIPPHVKKERKTAVQDPAAENAYGK